MHFLIISTLQQTFNLQVLLVKLNQNNLFSEVSVYLTNVKTVQNISSIFF